MEQPSVRDAVISFLETLSADVTLEDIMYHLYVREKINKGQQQRDAGARISEEDFEKQVDSWFK